MKFLIISQKSGLIHKAYWYNQNRLVSVATLGSHCALQVLKGAKDEGLKTILVSEKKREKLYKRFKFIDEIILVDSFSEITSDECQTKLSENNSVLIPHGTLIAQMTSEKIESIKTPIFGNKWILRWESDRELKEKLMLEAKLDVPKAISDPKDIDRLVIAKRQGAAGGKGYFMASSEDDYNKKREKLISQGVIKSDEKLYLQTYHSGVLADVHTNSPLVLRESLLDKVYKMGENFVDASRDLVPPGMNGPFCIEGVYDEEASFYTFEFSARIVAGTNIYMNGSPYSSLIYDEPMSMGRRIAREIKEANSTNQLEKITT